MFFIVYIFFSSIGKDSSNNNITIKKEDMSDTKESRNLAEECARLSVSPIYEEKVIKTELPDAVEEPLAKRYKTSTTWQIMKTMISFIHNFIYIRNKS